MNSELVSIICSALLVSILVFIACLLLSLILFVWKKLKITELNIKAPVIKPLFYSFLITALILAPIKYFYGVFNVQNIYMEPGFFAGDIISVKKREALMPGDVIVFTFDNKEHVSRVIGKPGDVVRAYDGKISINGNSIEQHADTQVNIKNFTFDVFNEEINSKRYKIIKSQKPTEMLYIKKLVVPEGKVFCLLDSRYAYGFSDYKLIDEKQIIGKVEKILFSFDFKAKTFRKDRTMKDPYEYS